jgi:hypothetical protein
MVLQAVTMQTQLNKTMPNSLESSVKGGREKKNLKTKTLSNISLWDIVSKKEDF